MNEHTHFDIPCGTRKVEIEVPASSLVPVVREPAYQSAINEESVIRESLRYPINSKPLYELSWMRKSAVVVVSDITRPVPNKILLPAILSEIEAAGIHRMDTTILIGTGLHRTLTTHEIIDLLGPEISSAYNVVCHDARDTSSLVHIGDTSQGVPVWINRVYMESDLKIITGLIEPHFMAGYSGGRKGVCPGIAGSETIKAFHSPELMDHPASRTGSLVGNPVHELSEEITAMAGIDFLINVTIDRSRKITGVFAGDWRTAFAAGAHHAGTNLTRSYAFPADLVITSAGGAPLDATFYQSVKGMYAGAQVVRPGGSVLLIAGCEEGVGSAEYDHAMRAAGSCELFFDTIRDPEYYQIDQWQIQKHCQAQSRAGMYFYTPNLPDTTLKELLVEPVKDPQAFIYYYLRKHPDASITVIPEGPYIIPGVEHLSEMEIYSVG